MVMKLKHLLAVEFKPEGTPKESSGLIPWRSIKWQSAEALAHDSDLNTNDQHTSTG